MKAIYGAVTALLAGVLLLSLAACGGQEKAPDTLGQAVFQTFQAEYAAHPQADLDTLAQALLTPDTVGFTPRTRWALPAPPPRWSRGPSWALATPPLRAFPRG